VFAPYVDDAHLARPDNGLVLFTLATVWAALRYQEQPTTGALVLAAACAALSVSVKYPGVANGLVVALAVLIVHHRSPRVVLWRLAGAAAVFVAVLFAAAPYVVLRMPVVLRVFAQEIRPHARAPALGFWGNLAFYVGDFMTEAGLVLSVFAIYGGYRVLREAGPRATPLFIGLVYWVGLSLPSVHWSRWGLPMYATPLLLAAVGMSSAGAAIDAMPRGRSRTAWFAALAMLLAIGVVAPLTESLVRVSAPYDHADPYHPPAPVLRAGSTGR
jgi:hypothetical protein